MWKPITAGVAAVLLMAGSLTACDEAQQQSQVPESSETDATSTEQDTTAQ